MAHQNTPAERQLLRLIEDLPLPVDVKTGWTDQLRSTGLSLELEEDIRKKLADDKEMNGVVRTRYDIELARLIRQWRMETGAKSFHK